MMTGSHTTETKRYAAFAVCVLGAAALTLLLPHFDSSQPQGLRISRSEAKRAADAQARRFGIPVDSAWAIGAWEDSPPLVQELAGDRDRLEAAHKDPVTGPRLGYYNVVYFRKGLEKNPPYGHVYVGKDGQIVGGRRTFRREEPGAMPDAAQLRSRADAFVKSRSFPGAPSPVFESARPSVLNRRVDHAFRYRVESSLPSGNLGYYLYVFFTGEQVTGWALIEESKDGTPFRYDTGSQLAETLWTYGTVLGLLAVLLVSFLRKYHAGEVGVGIGAFLLGVVLLLLLVSTTLTAANSSLGLNFGGIDAFATAAAIAAFHFLFLDVPLAVLAFLAWSVGESYARARWGYKLTSFDAVARRDVINATVGESLLAGLLTAPAVAAITLLPAILAIQGGFAHAVHDIRNVLIISPSAGPLPIIANVAVDAITGSVVGILLTLAFFKHHRLRVVGVLAAVLVGAVIYGLGAPVDPFWSRIGLSIFGMMAVVAVFLFYDLLATTVSLFTASLLIIFLPLLRNVEGSASREPLISLIAPLALLLLLAGAGLATRRRLSYEYEDVAPHVRRIVERERVKAEIDAANRIQAALLPSSAPVLPGASVASHYRSASEIGGDYFDFLPLTDGTMGLAFGDVAGHGLTSGIVMSMAKSALLVQLGYDSSPARVLEVLNDTVIRTAPKRMMMTFFFGVLDSRSHSLRFATAGHLDPYVYRAAGTTIESLSSWGFPLGVRRKEAFTEQTVRFNSGDRLVLYSDGLIEALDDDGEPFGFDRFEEVLRRKGSGSAEAIKKALLDALGRFTHNRPPEDDQTLVVVSFDEAAELPHPVSPAHSREARLAPA